MRSDSVDSVDFDRRDVGVCWWAERRWFGKLVLGGRRRWKSGSSSTHSAPHVLEGVARATLRKSPPPQTLGASAAEVGLARQDGASMAEGWVGGLVDGEGSVVVGLVADEEADDAAESAVELAATAPAPRPQAALAELPELAAVAIPDSQCRKSTAPDPLRPVAAMVLQRLPSASDLLSHPERSFLFASSSQKYAEIVPASIQFQFQSLLLLLLPLFLRFVRLLTGSTPREAENKAAIPWWRWRRKIAYE